MGDSNFVVGNSWMKRLTRPDPSRPRRRRGGVSRADATRADPLASARAGLTLGDVRRRAGLTQVVLAERLGVGQGDVSRLERRDDLLLSTLGNYLRGLGAESVRLTVRVQGEDIVLDLPALRPHA